MDCQWHCCIVDTILTSIPWPCFFNRKNKCRDAQFGRLYTPKFRYPVSRRMGIIPSVINSVDWSAYPPRGGRFSTPPSPLPNLSRSSIRPRTFAPFAVFRSIRAPPPRPSQNKHEKIFGHPLILFHIWPLYFSHICGIRRQHDNSSSSR
jgi:hypothetical protein